MLYIKKSPEKLFNQNRNKFNNPFFYKEFEVHSNKYKYYDLEKTNAVI